MKDCYDKACVVIAITAVYAALVTLIYNDKIAPLIVKHSSVVAFGATYAFSCKKIIEYK